MADGTSTPYDVDRKSRYDHLKYNSLIVSAGPDFKQKDGIISGDSLPTFVYYECDADKRPVEAKDFVRQAIDRKIPIQAVVVPDGRILISASGYYKTDYVFGFVPHSTLELEAGEHLINRCPRLFMSYGNGEFTVHLSTLSTGYPESASMFKKMCGFFLDIWPTDALGYKGELTPAGIPEINDTLRNLKAKRSPLGYY